MADPLDNIGDTLGKDVGPLPLGVWLLAVAGGLALSFYLNRDGGALDLSSSSSGGDDGGSTVAPPVGGLPTDGAVVSPGGPADTIELDDPAEPETNPQWKRFAFRKLLADGHGAITAWNALTNYLHGEQLTSDEHTLVELALQLAGTPPEGAPAVVPPTSPPADDPTAPDPPPDDADPSPAPEPDPEPEPTRTASWHPRINTLLQRHYRARDFVAAGVDHNRRLQITERTWRRVAGVSSGQAAGIVRQFLQEDLPPPDPRRLLRLSREVADGRQVTGPNSIESALRKFVRNN